MEQSDGGHVHCFQCFAATNNTVMIFLYVCYVYSLPMHMQGHLSTKFLEELLNQRVRKTYID